MVVWYIINFITNYQYLEVPLIILNNVDFIVYPATIMIVQHLTIELIYYLVSCRF